MIRLVRLANSGNTFQDAHVPLNRAFEMFQSGLICGTLVRLDCLRGTGKFDYDGSIFYPGLEHLNGCTAGKKTSASSQDGSFRWFSVFSDCGGIGNAPVEHSPVAFGHDASFDKALSLRLSRLDCAEGLFLVKRPLSEGQLLRCAGRRTPDTKQEFFCKLCSGELFASSDAGAFAKLCSG